MEREFGQSPDYSSDGNRRYTNPGHRNNLSDRHAPQDTWRHNDHERERDLDDYPSGQNQYGYNLSGQGMSRAARGCTSSARGGGFTQHFDTHLLNNNNGNYQQDYNMHADPPSFHNTNRNIENAYAYVKTTVGPSDTPRGPFRSTSESLTNTNPSETLKAYQQNTGQHGRDFDIIKGLGGNNDYQGLGSTNAFFDQVYEKLHPDQGKLDRGFADKNTGTKATKTTTRTFCEMATQTTEDDMPESTYNGVSVVPVTRTSTTQPAAVEQVPKPHRALDQPPSHVARPSNMTRDTRDTRDVREMEPKREVDPRRVQTIHKDEARDYTNHHNRTPSNPPPTSKIEINQWMSKPTVPIGDGNQAPGDGWGNAAANKAVGGMVDWSSGAVAEFPEEAKPTKMTVTHQWNQSRVQKAPVQPLPTSWGPLKKGEPKAETPHGQPSTSNLGWNNQRNVAQPQGRSLQGTKPTNEDPWLEDHPKEKKSTTWEISTTGHSPQDDQDAWVTEGNNKGGSNEWSFMAGTANAAWSTPAPAPTSWGSTPGIKTLITTPEQASFSSGPPVSVPPAQPTTSWNQPVSAPEQASTTWGQRISDAPEQPSTTWGSTSASPTSAKKVPLTSTERFNNSLQKLAAGYGGLSNRNNGSYEHTPRPAPTTSRWAPSSSSIGGRNNQVQTQPQQTHHRSTPSSSSTHSATNSSSPKVGPKDTPPPPVKAPGPNARRIQHNFANSPEHESAAAAAWVAASKSFSTKPSGLTTTMTTTTTTTTTAAIGTTSEGATEIQASKVTSRGGLLTTSNDFQSFLAASTFVPPALTTKPSSVSEGDASEAKDDAVTDPGPEPREEVGVRSNCGSQLTTTDHSDNKGSGCSVRGSGLSSTRGSELGSAEGSEPSDARPSEPSDSAWGEPVEKGGREVQDDGAPSLIVLEENNKDKEPKKEVDKVVDKPVDRTYSGSPLATSNDFQSFLNASCKFVPPVPTKKGVPIPQKISKDDKAKMNQTVDPEPEVPKEEDEKKEKEEKEEEKHGEQKHEVEVEKQEEKEEKEENHKDMRSDGGRQMRDEHSAKGLGPSDSGQPSESSNIAWGEPVERRQEAKDDGAHLNLLALEECDKEASKDVADKLQEASDKLEALQKAGQVGTKVADETALPVLPEVSQDSPIEPKVPEASLPASPEVRQDSSVELKAAAETSLLVSPPAPLDGQAELEVDAETSLLVSPPAPLDGQAELEVAAETTLPVSPSVLEEAGPVNFQIAETAVSVSPVS
ncbi:hypothetical protein BGZ82_002994 [Podila clonocystis]|nr:hypothetical protein BGZ82_002994 [Podila clonocystis]